MCFSRISKSLFLAFLCLFSLNLTAQENFITGFVVSLNGDTVKGLIDFRDWKENPKKVVFKKDFYSAPTTYLPQDIALFGAITQLRTEKYKSASVNIDTSSNDINKLDYNRLFNDKRADLFLRLIYKGKFNLYQYKDIKLHYFIEKDQRIEELKSKSYYLESQKTVMKNELFKAQLTDYLKECLLITQDEISRLEYKANQLIKILKKHDECIGEPVYDDGQQEKIKTTFAIVAGTDYSSLNTKDPKSGRVQKLNSFGNFVAGASMQINFPKNNYATSLIFEILYRKYQFTEHYEDFTSTEVYSIYDYKYSGNYLKINAMYRHQWNASNLRPFFNFGVSSAYKLADIDKTVRERKAYSSFTKERSPVFDNLRSFDQALNAGIGINVSRISIEMRGELSNGFSPYPNVNSAINTIYLNLNYKL